MSRRAVVTGAFSYTGAAVAAVLAGRGWQIHTLTNRRPFRGGAQGMSAALLAFETAHLERELRGADALVSTYWVRFPHAGQSFDTAVANARRLFEALRRAGVPRIVHLSVSNADLDSSLDYYRGKAKLWESVGSCCRFRLGSR